MLHNNKLNVLISFRKFELSIIINKVKNMTKEIKDKNDLKLFFLKNSLFAEVKIAQEFYEENKELCEALQKDRNNISLINRLRKSATIEEFRQIKIYLNDIRKSIQKEFAHTVEFSELVKAAFDFNLTRNAVNIAIMNHIVFKIFEKYL